MRDLEIKGDDLIVATHGRGFWILDNITALREWKPANDPVFFLPQKALRIKWDLNTDTPLPPDESTADNPPDGAILDYMLPSSASGTVTLEIRDSSGKAIRTFSSSDPVPSEDPKLEIPKYWLRPYQGLSGAPGIHRFLWDLHLAPVPGIHAEYPIAAVPRNTAPDPTSPWVLPEKYSAVLTVNGHSYSQPLNVEMDPRVKTPLAALAQQFNASVQMYEDARKLSDAASHADALREQLDALQQKSPEASAKTHPFREKLDAIAGGEAQGPPRGRVPETIDGVRGAALMLMTMMQDADEAPTAGMTMTAAEIHALVPKVLQKWEEFNRQDLPKLNGELRNANQKPLDATARGKESEVDMRGNEE
jgi:hypothetical protein